MEFSLNSDPNNIRMIRSLGNRIFQPWRFLRESGGQRRSPGVPACQEGRQAEEMLQRRGYARMLEFGRRLRPEDRAWFARRVVYHGALGHPGRDEQDLTTVTI